MLKVVRAGFLTSLAILSLSLFSLAQTGPTSFPGISIKNFGQMDEHFYRGSQPKKDDYSALKALGVNTVIDLQTDTTSYEKPTVESLGMKYINIPFVSGAYPKPGQIEEFLKIMDDPATGTVYVHCQGGKHRTGIAGAAYRLTKDGWDYDKVFQEMKNYNFYSSFGHEGMKTFVIDYAAKIKAAKTESAAAASSTAVR